MMLGKTAKAITSTKDFIFKIPFVRTILGTTINLSESDNKLNLIRDLCSISTLCQAYFNYATEAKMKPDPEITEISKSINKIIPPYESKLSTDRKCLSKRKQTIEKELKELKVQHLKHDFKPENKFGFKALETLQSYNDSCNDLEFDDFIKFCTSFSKKLEDIQYKILDKIILYQFPN